MSRTRCDGARNALQRCIAQSARAPKLRRTGWGLAGTTLVMAFGAYIASIIPSAGAGPGDAVSQIFGPGRWIARCLIVLGVLQGNVMNLYSAWLSTVTIYSGVKSMQASAACPKSY